MVQKYYPEIYVVQEVHANICKIARHAVSTATYKRPLAIILT